MNWSMLSSACETRVHRWQDTLPGSRTTIPQKAIRQEIAQMQEADPHLSFTVAWDRLMRQKPHLFDFEEPGGKRATAALDPYPPSPQQDRAAKIRQAQAPIHDALAALQQKGLTFQTAWSGLSICFGGCRPQLPDRCPQELRDLWG